MFQYCPNCAAPSPEFPRNRKIYCPACGFSYYHNNAAAVAVLIAVEDRYILLRRGKEPGKGLLDLPGGFVDPGESAEEACRREVMEEIGAEITDLEYSGSRPNTYPYGGITYNTCDLLFRARCGADSFIRQEEEIQEILLLKKEEISLDGVAFESIRRFLAEELKEN